MSTSLNLNWRLSPTALADAEAAIRSFSPVEPDLNAISSPLDAIRVETLAPDRTTSAWRRLYLSLYSVPRRIALVGSIDAVPELIDLSESARDLLIVETDTPTVSTAEFLPRGTEWRSLSEFGANLDDEDRAQLTKALISSLWPGALLVIGSRAGWEVVSRHRNALRSKSALFAAVAGSVDHSAASLLWEYLRNCLPALSALYGPDERTLREIARLFGLTSEESRKLQDLKDWRQKGGFLSSMWDR